jgi:hypothetical protein
MSSDPASPTSPTPHEPSTLAAILSFLIPGLGQIYQGRFGKGLLFMVCLLGMFFLGQAMGQWQNVYLPRDDGGAARRLSLGGSVMQRWHYMGQFWIGLPAMPALWQFFGMPMPDEEKSRFLHNYQKAPTDDQLNDILVNSDKTPDLGWVYTVIAGMLNLLVIYDAYAGPMIVSVRRPVATAPAASQTESKKEEA